MKIIWCDLNENIWDYVSHIELQRLNVSEHIYYENYNQRNNGNWTTTL